MKRCFVERKFATDTLKIIEQADEIIGQYQAQGYRMTLRQLYYQFVSKNLLANTERNYKRLGSILNDARYAGKIDWAAIEDRNRQPHHVIEFRDIAHRANVALANYRLDRWAGQPKFVELWVEKAALAGVLEPLADEWHVTLMVNRGYSSASAMYEAAQRFKKRYQPGPHGQTGIVLYLGDHDPSGEDMVRDIQSRFDLFGAHVEVVKLALTMDQVEEYEPPPNPAKTSDSRFNRYQEQHGDESWEVDALPPDVLADIIRTAFLERVSRNKMEAVIEQERADKHKFADALNAATEGESEIDEANLEVESPFNEN